MGARKLASQDDVKKFMGVVDKDNDGKVTRDELFNIIKKITQAF
jgi:Ca2+-binding EF-hand superfamily protein